VSVKVKTSIKTPDKCHKVFRFQNRLGNFLGVLVLVRVNVFVDELLLKSQ